jgi:hypothetical protein
MIFLSIILLLLFIIITIYYHSNAETKLQYFVPYLIKQGSAHVYGPSLVVLLSLTSNNGVIEGFGGFSIHGNPNSSLYG